MILRKSVFLKVRARLVFSNRAIVAIATVLCSAVAASAQVTFTGTQVSLARGTWSVPAAVAIDTTGNVFSADSAANSVYEMANSSSGLGSPIILDRALSNPRGVGVDGSGNLYISDSGNGRIVMLPLSTAGFGPAVLLATGLNNPGGLAVDAIGDVFVADSGNNRVIEIPLNGGSFGSPLPVTTGLSNPQSVAVDAARNLYIADTGNLRVLEEMYSSSAAYSTQQILASSINAVSVAVDRSNNLYIGDSGNQRILEKTWASWANRYGVQYLLGSGLSTVSGIGTDAAGDVYVADSGTGQLVELIPQSVQFGSVGVGATGSLLTYNFTVTAGTTLGSVGISMEGLVGKDFADAGGSSCLVESYAVATNCGVNVNFAPTSSGTRMGAINIFDGSGNVLATAYLSGTGLSSQARYFPGSVSLLGSQLAGPAGVAVDGAGNLYIADTGNNRIVMIPWTGSGYGPQVTLPINGVSSPMGLAFDGAGNLYIASNGNDRVLKLPRTQSGFGTAAKVGIVLDGPMGVTVDRNGSLYIADTLDSRIDKLPWSGTSYLAEQEIGNYHRSPIGLAVNAIGDVYFSDPYHDLLATTTWTGSAYSPQTNVNGAGTRFDAALAVDGNSNLYILDGVNNSVLMLPWTGSAFGPLQTVALGFNAPSGITVDSNGVLYVADTGNNQIVRIDFSAPQPLSFASTSVGSTSSGGAQSEVLQNLGNQPITLVSATYPADFPESTTASPCAEGTSLSPTQWCQIAVEFAPTTVSSPLVESVQIVGNLLGNTVSQQSVTLTGGSTARQTQQISLSSVPAVVYGAAPMILAATASSGLPVQFSVLSGPGLLDSTGRILKFTGVGTVLLQANQAGNGTFQAANPVSLSIPVKAATLTVTPTNKTGAYGAIPTTFSYSITGFVAGDNVTAVTGAPLISSSAKPGSGAGSYVLLAAQGSLAASNYTFVFSPGVLTVNKASLLVFPSSLWQVFGSAMPKFTWSVSGLLNGDGPGVVAGSPFFTTTAKPGSPVGSYLIQASQGSLSAANYTFDIRSATLSVVPAVLMVAATNLTIQYGDPFPKLAYTISGLANGDLAGSVIQGQPALSTSANPQSGAGNYSITSALGSLSASNYIFRFSNGLLVINKAVLTVTPVSDSMTYGGPLPKFSFAYAGFVRGDTVATATTGNPSVMTDVNSTSRPGHYGVNATIGTLNSRNYRLVFGSMILAINRAVLTVTPSPATLVYGAAMPHFAYTLSGFMNGDTASAVQGAANLTTEATSKSHVGTYAITAVAGSLTSPCYNFQMQTGTLTVTKAVLKVAANMQSMVYGASTPSLTYAVTGFVAGDASTVVSGTPALTTTAGSAAQVGTYPIAVAIGSLSATNYSFSTVGGVLTVNKAVLKVIATNATMMFGSSLPQLNYTVSGLVGGDKQSAAVGGAPSLTTTAKAGVPFGTYAISVAQGTMTARNYSFQFVGGQLQVNRAPLSIVANSLSMKSGGTVPTLTYTATGLVNGDTLATATTGTPLLSTSATSTATAGTYAISVASGTLRANNYQLSYTNGKLTVTQ